MCAMFVAGVVTCVANNEKKEYVENAAEASAEVETVAEAPEMMPEANTAEIVLDMIDPAVSSRFYVNEERQLFVVEVGARFIRVKDLNGKLVSTISKYLATENGTWVENADCVMQYEGQFLPAKRILNGKGITYRAAKHAQYVPMKRVRSVEKEYQIWL